MNAPVLVTGATGKQGGAAARALLATGTPVRALVRDPGTAAARALADAGAALVTGDLDDPPSVTAAARGSRGVFSVQMPDLEDLLGGRELRHAESIAAAVREAGVAQVVHTSVSGVAELGRPGAIDPGVWGEHMAHYWRSKAAAEDAIAGSGARWVTRLRPATFMENFMPWSPYLVGGDAPRMLLAMDPDRTHPFVAVADIGAAAAAAFADPDRFDGVALDLVGERLSYRQAATALTEAWGVPFTLTESPEQAVAEGMAEVFLQTHAFLDAHPRVVGPERAREFGLDPVGFAAWARAVGRPQTLRLPSAR